MVERFRCRYIYKLFSGMQALHDVGFHVKYGEVHTMLGEYEAGKYPW